MAMTFVGFAGPRSGVFFYPAGIQADDICILLTTTGTVDFTGDTGGGTWAQGSTSSGNTLGQTFWWKRFTGSASTSSWGGVSGYYSLYVIRGTINTGEPWLEYSNTYSSSPGSSMTATLSNADSPAFFLGHAIRNQANSTVTASTDSMAFSGITGGGAELIVHGRWSADSIGTVAWNHRDSTAATDPTVVYQEIAPDQNSSAASMFFIALTDTAPVTTTPVSQTVSASYNVEARVTATLESSWVTNDTSTDPVPGTITYHRRTGVFSRSDSGTINVGWPDLGDASALKNGDIVFALVIADAGFTFPNGWSLIAGSGIYSGTQRVYLLWRRLASGVSGTFAVTVGNRAAIQLFSFRGTRVDGDPFDASVTAYHDTPQTSISTQLSGFNRNNSFLLAFGARMSLQNMDDTLTFSNVTGGTDTTIYDTTYNSDVVAIPLAWYRQTTTTSDPIATLTYGSLAANPTAGLFAVALTSTSAVAQSLAVEYPVLKSITNELSSTYRVKQTIAPQQIATSWAVRLPSPVEQVSASWKTLQSVPQNVAASWKTASRVATSAGSTWKVRAGVTRSVVSSWGLKGGVRKDLLTAWQVRPFETPFVWGHEGPSNSADDTGDGSSPRGQVFTAPVGFNKIEANLATYGAQSRTARFNIYNAATGGTVVATGTVSHGDNVWVPFTFTRLNAGTYRLEIVDAISPNVSSRIAWWTNTASTFSKGYATNGGGTATTGDRVFRITGATQIVGIGRPYNHNVLDTVAASLSSTYNLLEPDGKVYSTMPTSWDVEAETPSLVSSSIESTWGVESDGVVVKTLSSSWNTKPISSPFIWGFEGPETVADGTSGTVRGQVFYSPVRFNKVEVKVATFGAQQAGAIFHLRGVSGTPQVFTGSVFFGDNSWATITFPAQPAGGYWLRMEAAGGTTTAWWANDTDPLNNTKGYATDGGTTGVNGGVGAVSVGSKDRLFRVTGVTAPVSSSLASTFVIEGKIVASVDSSWAVESFTTPIDAGLAASWRTRALATAAAEQSWVVFGNAGRVSNALPASWKTRAQRSASVASTWRVHDESDGIPAHLSTTWRVQPYATPFVWGHQGDASYAENLDAIIAGQVFTIPVSFDRAEAFVATYATASASARFTLYDGATSNTIVWRQTISSGDNSWAGITFPRQNAGTYRLTMEKVSGQMAWWSTAADVFPHGYATNMTSPAGGDRVFRITGATRSVVGTGQPLTYGTGAYVTSSLTTTYRTDAVIIQVENAFEASWGQAALATAESAQTWSTRRQVSSSLETSYELEVGVAASLETTYGVTRPASADRVSTWNVGATVVSSPMASSWKVHGLAVRSVAPGAWRVAARVTTSVSVSFAALRPVASVTASSFKVYRPATKTLTQSFKVKVQVGSSKALTFQVLRPVASTVTTTYVVTALPGKVVGEVSTSYRVRARVTAPRATTWSVRVPFAKSTAMAPWRVYRPVAGASAASTWNARRTVAMANGQTYKVRSRVTAPKASAWKVYATTVSPAATTWHVRRSVQNPKQTSFRVLQRLQKPIQETWQVRVPVLSPNRTWEWQTLRSAPRPIVSPAWKIRELVSANTVTRWNVESNLSGQVNIVVEMANYRSTVNVPWNRVTAEVPSVRVSTEVSGGDRAIPVAANE